MRFALLVLLTASAAFFDVATSRPFSEYSFMFYDLTSNLLVYLCIYIYIYTNKYVYIYIHIFIYKVFIIFITIQGVFDAIPYILDVFDPPPHLDPVDAMM